MCGGSLAYRNAAPAARSASTGPRNVKCPRAGPMKNTWPTTSSNWPTNMSAMAIAWSPVCWTTQAGVWHHCPAGDLQSKSAERGQARGEHLATWRAEGPAKAEEKGTALAEQRIVRTPAAWPAKPRLVLRLRPGSHRWWPGLPDAQHHWWTYERGAHDPRWSQANSTDVLDALTDLFILRGLPEYIRSDNGPEFIAQKVRDWIAAVGAKTAYIEPGSPWENGYCESLNARFRGELLNGEIFYSLNYARSCPRDGKQLRPPDRGTPSRLSPLRRCDACWRIVIVRTSHCRFHFILGEQAFQPLGALAQVIDKDDAHNVNLD